MSLERLADLVMLVPLVFKELKVFLARMVSTGLVVILVSMALLDQLDRRLSQDQSSKFPAPRAPASSRGSGREQNFSRAPRSRTIFGSFFPLPPAPARFFSNLPRSLPLPQEIFMHSSRGSCGSKGGRNFVF